MTNEITNQLLQAAGIEIGNIHRTLSFEGLKEAIKCEAEKPGVTIRFKTSKNRANKLPEDVLTICDDFITIASPGSLTEIVLLKHIEVITVVPESISRNKK